MSLPEGRRVKVGSRKSELALIQTNYVISLLKELHPTIVFEIVTMTTLGDRILNISLPKIGEKSLFTKDLEEALANGSVDMVVHSLKDLPTTLPDGMAIGAVLKREDPNDALVLREDFKGHSLATLPAGSIIGTSSLRRTAQLTRGYPHLKVVDIRGNLNTRLKKLDHHYHLKMNKANGCMKPDDDNDDVTYPNYAALMLARAGLVRMGWQDRISEVLPSNEVLYAVGQGALAIECRANNDKILEMLAPLNDKLTYCKILSERSFLKTLGGGCSTPVAICTTFELNSDKSKRKMEVVGAVWSLDGKKKIQEAVECEFDPCAVIEDDDNSKTKSAKHKLEDDNNLPIINEINTAKKVCIGLKNDTENGNANTEYSKTIQVKCPYYDNCLIQMPASEDSSEKQVIVNNSTSTYDKMLYRKAMKEVEPVEVENLIGIHGKLFWACPNVENCSARMKSKGDNQVNENAPTNNFKEILVKIHMRKSLDIKKCPFMANQVVAYNAQNELSNAFESSALVRSERAKNCLFLNAYEKNGNGVSAVDVKLYCGLTKHFSLSEEVIVKCEEIGKELAQSLIGRGALEIMKSAQDSIHKPPKQIMPHNIPLGDDFQGVCPVISHENN